MTVTPTEQMIADGVEQNGWFVVNYAPRVDSDDADEFFSYTVGLAKTAGVITGAALIMVSVFAAFALAEVITIKSIGVGMAIAVLVDATIIRVLLVPATMRLMGKWNWWAPGILGRFVDRLGFSHVEDDDGVDGATGATGPAAPGSASRLVGP